MSTPENTFGMECADVSLPQDSQRKAIQSAQKLVFEDGTGTPQTSPLTNKATVQTIVPPVGAMVCVLNVYDTTLNTQPYFLYGDNSTLDGTNGHGVYKSIGEVRIPCCKGNSIYVKKTAAGGNIDIYFSFESIKVS